jgi:hypothetical protein
MILDIELILHDKKKYEREPFINIVDVTIWQRFRTLCFS